MKFQSTFPQTRGDGRPNLLGLPLRPAMHDGIVGVTLKPHLRIALRQPPIKGVVQEQIRNRLANKLAPPIAVGSWPAETNPFSSIPFSRGLPRY